jgi:hypothetical protein
VEVEDLMQVEPSSSWRNPLKLKRSGEWFGEGCILLCSILFLLLLRCSLVHMRQTCCRCFVSSFVIHIIRQSQMFASYDAICDYQNFSIIQSLVLSEIIMLLDRYFF